MIEWEQLLATAFSFWPDRRVIFNYRSTGILEPVSFDVFLFIAD
jgi:hypothetical protein